MVTGRTSGTAAGTCTLELVIDAGIATGMVCPLGRCNRRGNGPGTGLRKTGRKVKDKKSLLVISKNISVFLLLLSYHFKIHFLATAKQIAKFYYL